MDSDCAGISLIEQIPPGSKNLHWSVQLGQLVIPSPYTQPTQVHSVGIAQNKQAKGEEKPENKNH